MLSENIKATRRAKGLSQEELAHTLNVVRQTVSKWEQGLSVPDADLLLALSEALETPVSALLGETLPQPEPPGLRAIAERLEAINGQLARKKAARKRLLHWLLMALCAAIASIFGGFLLWGDPYLGWEFTGPESAVAGTAVHAFSWLFVRLAPPVFAAAMAGIVLTRRKS